MRKQQNDYAIINSVVRSYDWKSIKFVQFMLINCAMQALGSLADIQEHDTTID